MKLAGIMAGSGENPHMFDTEAPACRLDFVHDTVREDNGRCRGDFPGSNLAGGGLLSTDPVDATREFGQGVGFGMTQVDGKQDTAGHD